MTKQYGRLLIPPVLGVLVLLAFMIQSQGDTSPGEATPEPGVAPESSIIAPRNESVLLSRSVDIIYRLETADEVFPPLTIDGQAADWDPIVGDACTKRVCLSLGRHELMVGEESIECVIAMNEVERDAPDDWNIYRSHYISGQEDRCGQCHELSKEASPYAIGPFLGPESCVACHPADDFELTHMHVPQPLEGCHECHAMHGAKEEHLLKAPIRELCADCHDPDH